MASNSKPKFAQAKIKKMLQVDEDMGKVASGAPVVISRALEMFISALTKQSCEVAEKAGSRTLSAGHLKMCIEGNPQFDYLKTFVADVPLPSAEEKAPKAKRKTAAKGGTRPAKRSRTSAKSASAPSGGPAESAGGEGGAAASSTVAQGAAILSAVDALLPAIVSAPVNDAEASEEVPAEATATGASTILAPAGAESLPETLAAGTGIQDASVVTEVEAAAMANAPFL
eukprot:gene5346-2284_t